MRRIAVVAALGVAALALAVTSRAETAHGCAFPGPPDTYEGPRSRAPYLIGLELAGSNMIAPNDGFFGTPNVETGTRGSRTIASEPYIPPILLKSIGWIESAQAQAAGSVPWSATGPALVSFDCGHGIMQITSGMTNPADSVWPSKNQALVATHYMYNIARGAAILVEKWNAAPEARPIAGTDTNSDPEIVENWYFALWSYNGFTGPGANRSNHPMDPDYAWPRTGFSCGPANDGYGHTYGTYPYQEIVMGCAARPPSAEGSRLWNPINLSLPDLNDSRWSGPLNLSNFTSSDGFRRMDMPSPQPYHHDNTPRPSSGALSYLMGSPDLSVDRTQVDESSNRVRISNNGDRLLAWRAKPRQQWVYVSKLAGVALGSDVTCGSGNPCLRSPTVEVTIDPARAPANGEPGIVDIESLTTGETITVFYVRQQQGPRVGDAGCDGTVNSIDAAVILQFTAGLLSGVPCPGNADVNRDAFINAIDAALILQFESGLVSGL